VEIDAVEQGAGESGQVAGGSAGEQAQVGSEAQPRWQGLAAATSWKRAGKVGGARGAGAADAGVLDRLAQGLQHALGELGQLVHEQHAVMGKADLAGMGNPAAADEAGLGRGVVRAAAADED